MKWSASPRSMSPPPKTRFAPSRCSMKCCPISFPTPSRQRTSRPTTVRSAGTTSRTWKTTRSPTSRSSPPSSSNGISFHPDEKYLKDTQESGVDPSVVQALRTAKYARRNRAALALQEDRACKRRAIPTKLSHRQRPSAKDCTALRPSRIAVWKRTAWRRSGPSDNEMLVHISTQNLSGIAPQIAEPLGIPAGNIQVMQQYIGGGFGSKFAPDRWGIASAQLSKTAGGKPVKIMLERDAEQEVAGMRPSAFARVKIAADKDGKLVAWESRSWGTGGMGGGGTPPLPYIFEDSQPAQAERRHLHESGKRAGLACAESSAGRGHHHGAHRRPCRQAEHRSAGLHHPQPGSRRPARQHLSR